MEVLITIKGTDHKNREIDFKSDSIEEAIDILMLLNGDISEEDLQP